MCCCKWRYYGMERKENIKMKTYYLFGKDKEPLTFVEIEALPIAFRNIQTQILRDIQSRKKLIVYYREIVEDLLPSWLSEVEYELEEDYIFDNQRFEKVVFIKGVNNA